MYRNCRNTKNGVGAKSLIKAFFEKKTEKLLTSKYS